VFRSEFDDFQNASFLGLNFLVRNAESVVTQGIELDGSVRPVTGLTIDYAVTYLDAEYDEFTNVPATSAARRPMPPSAPATERRDAAQRPTWRSNLGMQYEQPVAAGTDSSDGLVYSSEQNVDTALDPRAEQGSYSSCRPPRLRNDRYSVSVWGDNLTDETVMTAVGPQTIFGGIDGGLQVYLNESRTYGVTMDVRF